MATMNPFADHHDPIEVMTEIVDGFAHYVDSAERQVREGRKYRVNLLWVHAVAALLMAPAFAGLGRSGMVGATWIYLRHVPGAPYSIAICLGIGGLVLGIGCLRLDRKMEAVGLLFLAAFYLTIAVGFGLANVAWYRGLIPGPKPAPYAPVLYLHLTVIMAVHINTLLRLIRRSGSR